MHVTTTFGVSFLKRDDETPYEYLLSFSPMAPFFGVPWRFAEAFQPDPAFSKAAERTAFKASETAEKMAEESVRTAQRAAETMQRSSAAAQRMVEDAVEVAAEGSEAVAKTAAETTVEAVKSAAEAIEKTAPKPAPTAKVEPFAKAEEAAPAVEAAVEPVVETVKDAGKDLFGAEEDPDAGKPGGLLAKAPADADDLKAIKGVGPKVEAELNALGIYTFKQIAGFSEDNLAWLASNLGSVRGRGLRSDFVEQARTLAG